ncbi:MAG: homoserine kinase [Candidatus Latescibacteria bacterium]|jgi:homoserine kinase|nr:homoserine kinase [Candidatus Latescibacterota bacterium]MBT4139985.1 homoserine kinase [Candidatus Latescibacterota bacterium]
MEFQIRTPGSTANLGPGFDALGLALSIYNHVTIMTQSTPGLEITVQGEGKDLLTTDETNLFYQAAQFTAQKIGKPLPGLSVALQNGVPLARGLGSSSTAIVAGVIAANHILDQPFSQQDQLNIATEIEGHPDNVSPCLLGGLTMSALDGKQVACVRALPPDTLQSVVAIPEFELKTSEARQALPQEISLHDAVFSISRACLVTAALMSGDLAQLKIGMQDCLHQPYRAHLIPNFHEAIDAALQAGSLGAALSGAGPTLMAFATQNADAIGQAMVDVWQKNEIEATYHVLNIDTDGAVIL